MVYLKTNSVTSLGGANARVSSLTYSPAVSGTDSNPSAAWGSSGYRAWFDVSSIPSSITVTYSYKDDYGSTQATRTVVSASVPIDIGFNGTGIGIGKNVESNNLIDLGLNVRARRDLQVDGALEGIEDLIPRIRTNAAAFPVVFVPQIGYTQIEPNHQTNEYLKNWLKWVCANYPNRSNATFIGSCRPNSQGIIMCFIYETSIVNAEGLPQYACGQYTPLGSNIYTFGTSSYVFYFGAAVNSMSWDSITDKPSTFTPAAHTQAISQGGTGATSASAALSNLGAAPIANLKRVDLWQGTCHKGGSVTVTNAYRYSVLWLVVTPGSGESEIIACEYNNRAAVRQICSNNSWIGITSSISGNNKTFTVSGGNDGCKLTKIVGAVRFQ